MRAGVQKRSYFVAGTRDEHAIRAHVGGEKSPSLGI